MHPFTTTAVRQFPAQTTFGERRSSAPEGMTERQRECLAWVQEGKSANDIGTILGISRRTVEWHLTGACELLGVRTRLQAVIKARDLGVIGSMARP